MIIVLLTEAVSREQAGVTIDLGHDPTLVCRSPCLCRLIAPPLDVHTHSSPIPTCYVPPVIMMSACALVLFVQWRKFGCSHLSPLTLHSAVFYQDQSKRRETRMILFYVCCKCGNNFMDPNLKEYTGPQGGGGQEG